MARIVSDEIDTDSGMVEAEVLPLNYTRMARDPSKYAEVRLLPRLPVQ